MPPGSQMLINSQMALRLEKFDPAKHSSLVENLTKILHAAYAPLAEKGQRYWASYQTPEDTFFRLNQGESYLGFYGDSLVGTVCLWRAKPDHSAPWYRRQEVFSIHQFAVAPEHQGRGIGTQMMDQMEKRAAELGAQEIALDTSEHAHELIALYSKRGYRFVEHAQWNKVNYRSVILSKRLLPSS